MCVPCRFLLVLRALRPLRLISLLPSMRRVISDVLLGWRDFGKAVVILFSFVFMFASLGVQVRACCECASVCVSV